LDPFILPVGTELTIPTLWIVPNNHGNQIIVNTGEMRLSYFVNNNTQVYTFPIGMGVLDFRTLQGNFSGDREKGEAGLAYPQVIAGQVRHGRDAAGGR
jgi:L,D-transpeptidase ErfK/SrfK